ncbi:helix-turn-helix transcriptional regulator [Enterococcus gallinarum]|mgnify:CR=1 FL=1|uniref:AraC family transcriptional regulator n=1 Tax=Enterococcus gallinarum TaxID=1353 RepID=A0ABD4ZWR7_ENTGA|nr:AraC family transcriptional regulator [Enterococcus gallinarum]MBX8979355.1 helix-turn-helix transcriptional regulator [Enterococcus gallinarum]MCR1932101.1 AraC family transcriptional regulator [Enterococcus gallinarum]MDL4876616.1 AraC family transcriptional regulator [Enterococcus gallinarum]MDL4883056.1 AraC family transcriptional regulator [Enterococcus gallinarum]MDL4886638.1 AraC family transcriptional regulator [Enterococcus gallinarum]
MDYSFSVYEGKESINLDIDSVSLIFALEGKITVINEENKSVYSEYSFLIRRAYQPLEFIVDFKKIIILSINKLSFNRFTLFNWSDSLVNKSTDNEIIESFLSVIKSIYEDDIFSADINVIKLINYMRSNNKYKDISFLNDNLLVKEVIDYIDSNYKEPLTVSSIAKKFYVSTSYLSRIFSETMNISLLSYIRKIKIYHLAAELIFNLSPQDSWRNYGYESYETYLKNFKSVFSVSPSEFLLKYKRNRGKDYNVSDLTYIQVINLLENKKYLK